MDLLPDAALSPLTPGVTSITFNCTLIGSFTLIILSLNRIVSTISFGFKNFDSSPICSVVNSNLFEGLSTSEKTNFPLLL